ncbi:nitrogenase component 1, partial [Protofrankia coriariae]
MTPPVTSAETQAMIDDVLSAYPPKVEKDRQKHVKPNDPGGAKECEVKSNVKSRPGIMTLRGCAYAGSKGVVWGPIKDLISISHGPVGCGQYTWGTRRNYANGQLGVDNFTVMQITSDFQEKDIVFGGDKKLAAILDELVDLFPLAKGVSIQSECPIGLIGDDIDAVATAATKRLD